ncbi:MAG: hypothetical protein R3B13_25645 [Polyangiaceae bacterium]
MTRWMTVVLAATTLVFACGEDEKLGGSGGGAGLAGASGSGGGAGTATGGAAGSSGDAATGGSDAGDAAAGASALLVAGTDFFSETEVAWVDLATLKVLGRVTLSDGDAVPVASSGRGFVLSRTTSQVVTMDSSGNSDKTISVDRAAISESGTAPTNPSRLVATSTNSAWVTLYDANRIAKLDLAAGSVSKTVDLSSYLDAGDGDGAVDVDNAVLDAVSGRLYFTVARIDRTTVAAPDFQLACPTTPALLMALDVATDAIVDLNGSDAGDGVALSLQNPVDMVLDADGGRLVILHAGCFAAADAGKSRVAYGVEAVPLGTLTPASLLSPTSGDFLSRLLLLASDSAVIDRFDTNFSEFWSLWKPSNSSLGSDLSGVPGAAIVEDADHLLGVSIEAAEAGTSARVQRYTVSTQTATTLVDGPWLKSYDFAAGNALVR